MHDPVAQQADDLLTSWDAWLFFNTAKNGGEPLQYAVIYEPTLYGHRFVVRTKQGVEQQYEVAFKEAVHAMIELNRCGTRSAAAGIIKKYVWPCYRVEQV